MGAPTPPNSALNLEEYDLRKPSIFKSMASAFDYQLLLFHVGMPACIGLVVALASSVTLGGVAALGTMLGLLNFQFQSFVQKRSRSQYLLTRSNCTDELAELVSEPSQPDWRPCRPTRPS